MDAVFVAKKVVVRSVEEDAPLSAKGWMRIDRGYLRVVTERGQNKQFFAFYDKEDNYKFLIDFNNVSRVQATFVHNADNSIRKGRTIIWLKRVFELRSTAERYMILMDPEDHERFHSQLTYINTNEEAP